MVHSARAMSEEQVYVLPAHLLPSPQPAMIPYDEALLQILRTRGFYMSRGLAEENPSFRQIIPYALVRYLGRFWAMRRLSGSGESRLIDRYSLGVGGHINPVDAQGCPILSALRRELLEEVGVGAYTAQPVGFILLDDSPVNRVHAGVVFMVEAGEEPRAMESDKLEGSLLALEDLQAYANGFEAWSGVVYSWLMRPAVT